MVNSRTVITAALKAVHIAHGRRIRACVAYSVNGVVAFNTTDTYPRVGPIQPIRGFDDDLNLRIGLHYITLQSML